MSHDYKPGDPIEVRASLSDVWEHEGRTYIGEWQDHIVYGLPGYGTDHIHPSCVRPYSPPIEIPEGWQLMRSDGLIVGVHEVYDADDDPPLHDYGLRHIGEYPVLVVARRRADT